MTPERWQQVKVALHHAMELEPEERSAYLSQMSQADPDLGRQVDSLLASEDRAGSGFLNTPVLNAAGLLDPEPAGPMIGRRIGPYEILEQIGAGGMGEVYKAFRADDAYRKQVAIKLIRAGQDSQFVVARFRNERQILATLEHPNIARLLDGGTTEDGNPYFVMELIEGEPIDQYCEKRNLGVTGRLKLFVQVCSAVQYAHQRLIIHRDIKPGNILVTSEGMPKLLDFGIAKILTAEGAGELPERTVTALRLLTPGYASPEQVRGEAITTASDVYSLGVVLYELLTGCSPYKTATGAPQELARSICDEQPEKPSTRLRQNRQPLESGNAVPTSKLQNKAREVLPEKRSKRLRGDLDNIVLMALRKEPQRRYVSVEQLAGDIQRHLENLPVTARQDSFGYRASKFVVRHKAGVAAAALIAISLIAGLTAALYEAGLARQQQSRAEKRFNDVRRLANSLLFDIHDAIRELPGSTPARKILVDRALQYLDSLAGESGNDASLLRELATAYERVAMVQGYYLQDSLGDTTGSLHSFQKAAAIRERLLAARPGDVPDTLAWSRCSTNLANQLWATGDRTDAAAAIKKAIAVIEPLHRRQPDDLKIMAELSWDYSLAHSVIGDYEYVPKAIALDEVRLKLSPDDEMAMNAYAMDLKDRADHTSHQGATAQVLQDYQKALDIDQKVYQRNPSPRWEAYVAGAYGDLARLYDSMGNDKLAGDARLKALDIYERRAQADPRNIDLQTHLSIACINAGLAFAKAGNQQRSLELMHRGLEAMLAVVALDSSNVERRTRLANVYFAIGDVYRNFHQPAVALDSYQKSKAFFEERRVTEPKSAYYLLKIAGCWQFMGIAELNRGRPDLAQDDFRQAIAIAEPFLAATPLEMQAVYAIADSYSGLGDAEFAEATHRSSDANRHWLAAQSAYQHSLAAWKKIDHPSANSPWGFDAGDPRKVATNLARCAKALQSTQTP